MFVLVAAVGLTAVPSAWALGRPLTVVPTLNPCHARHRNQSCETGSFGRVGSRGRVASTRPAGLRAPCNRSDDGCRVESWLREWYSCSCRFLVSGFRFRAAARQNPPPSRPLNIHVHLSHFGLPHVDMRVVISRRLPSRAHANRYTLSFLLPLLLFSL